MKLTRIFNKTDRVIKRVNKTLTKHKQIDC